MRKIRKIRILNLWQGWNIGSKNRKTSVLKGFLNLKTSEDQISGLEVFFQRWSIYG